MTYRDKTVPWTVDVMSVNRINDVFVHVVCGMPSNVQLSIGDTIAVDVEPTAAVFRRYTVSKVLPDSFEFVAFRTQRGPATAYLDGLAQGAQLHGQGPERPIKLPSEDMSAVAVMGDETVVGTAVAVIESTTAPVAIAMKSSVEVPLVQLLPTATQAVTHSDDESMKKWLTEFVEQHGTDNVGIFLVGGQSANQLFRQHAFGLGVHKDRVATRTFWRPDKAGIE